ncbi:MAG: hypothetical protein ACLU6Y_12750 [Ruminococcus sp.]
MGKLLVCSCRRKDIAQYFQTVEITSAYENAFSNEQVELVAGEDDATGSIGSYIL